MPRIVGYAKHILRTARDCGPSLRLMASAASAAARYGVRRGRADGRGPDVLFLAPPGAGNVGDQAMLEAFCANVPGRITVVVDQHAAYRTDSLPSRVSLVRVRAIHSGWLGAQLAAFARLGRLAGTASSVALAGADVIDGAYHARSVVGLWSWLTACADSGRPVRVVGFSWRGCVRADVVRAARRAARAGVELVARDPLSAERLREAGIAGVVEAADMVFCHRAAPTQAVVGSEGGTPLAIVNVNAQIAQRPGALDGYVEVVRLLRDRGLRIVAVPHAYADVDALRALVRRAGEAGVTVEPPAERLPSPDEVVELAARAEVVVTGRMHLSILSMVAGTPAVALSYNGKVEGLMSVVGMPECVVAVDDVGSPRTLQVIADLIGGADMPSRVVAGAFRARSAARSNFTGLTAAWS